MVKVLDLNPNGKNTKRCNGPYVVRGHSISDRVKNVMIYNPFVGPTSSFEVSADDLIAYPDANLTKRHLLSQEEFDPSARMSPTLRERVSMVKEKLKKENVSHLDLIGQHVEIDWGKGLWMKGLVIDYEPMISKHWIKGEKPKDDGDDTYPQALITGRPPKWRFANL